MYKVLSREFASLSLAISYASEKASSLGRQILVTDSLGRVIWSSINYS